MRTSPIQLLGLQFRTVRVELNGEYAEALPDNPKDKIFSFDRVVIDTAVGASEVEAPPEHGSAWSLFLAVRVDNKADESMPKQRFCPYNVFVEVQGFIVAAPNADKIAPVEDLIRVNGTALLWAAVREQVSSITARMSHGIILLPTVNFHDLKKDGDTQKPMGEPSVVLPPPFAGAINVDSTH